MFSVTRLKNFGKIKYYMFSEVVYQNKKLF
jgi:hypothetical protein